MASLPSLTSGGALVSSQQERMGPADPDWLSNLPDCVLVDILSRLEAKEVVKTCVLSKKWLKHWTFVPRLVFDYHRTPQVDERSIERFENFVNTILRLRDDATSLHTFTLVHKQSNSPSTKMWINYALKHYLKKLDLVLEGRDPIHLPDSLFNCESLEDVNLDFQMLEWAEKIKPDKVFLPRLKDLTFSNAHFEGDYMAKLLNGCPALESLCLLVCTLEMKTISFRTLKKLYLISCEIVGNGFPPGCSISAPVLEFFEFLGVIWLGVKLKHMSKVTEAEITTNHDTEDDYNLDLLSSLSGVEKLKLDSLPFEETLEAELPRCPIFYNLKNLTLGEGCMYCYFRILSSFLRRCPNLEVLTLTHRHEYDDIQEDEGQSCEQIKSFSCKRLKKIEVIYPSFDSHVDQLVQRLSLCTAEIEGIQIKLTKSEANNLIFI